MANVRIDCFGQVYDVKERRGRECRMIGRVAILKETRQAGSRRMLVVDVAEAAKRKSQIWIGIGSS